MAYLTKNEIIASEWKRLSEDEKLAFGRIKEIDLILLHHSYGRLIRNKYFLWAADNPLTMKDYEEMIEDGCDVNPNHPDHVSMNIIKELHAMCEAANAIKRLVKIKLIVNKNGNWELVEND